MNEGENSRKRIKFPNVSFFGYTAPFLEVFTNMFCGLGADYLMNGLQVTFTQVK